MAPVAIAALEVDVDFGVDPDEPDEPLGAVVVAPLAAVVPVPVEGVVVDAGVAPLLVAAVAAVADPLKQLVEPPPC